MVDEGRAQYADPSSMIKAASLLLNHVGFVKRAQRLQMALDLCAQFERKLKITGRSDGATGSEFAAYIVETLNSPDLETRWQQYQ
jgi:isocitrate dehydrogenase (NAD+)